MGSTTGIGKLGLSHREGISEPTSVVRELDGELVLAFGRDSLKAAAGTLAKILRMPRRARDIEAVILELNHGKPPLPGCYVGVEAVRQRLAPSHAKRRLPTATAPIARDVSTARKRSDSSFLRERINKQQGNNKTAVGAALAKPIQAADTKSQQSARHQLGETVAKIARVAQVRGAAVASAIGTDWPKDLGDVLVRASAEFSTRDDMVAWMAKELTKTGIADAAKLAQPVTDVLLQRTVELVALRPTGDAIAHRVEQTLNELDVYQTPHARRLLVDELFSQPLKDAVAQLAAMGMPDDDLVTALIHGRRDDVQAMVESRVPERRVDLHRLMHKCREGGAALQGSLPLYNLAKHMPQSPLKLAALGLPDGMRIEDAEKITPTNAAQQALVQHIADWSRDKESNVLMYLAIGAGAILSPTGLLAAVAFASASRAPGALLDEAHNAQLQLLQNAGAMSQEEVDRQKLKTHLTYLVGTMLGSVNGASNLGKQVVASLGGRLGLRFLEQGRGFNLVGDGLLEAWVNKLTDAAVAAPFAGELDRFAKQQHAELQLSYDDAGGDARFGPDGLGLALGMFGATQGPQSIAALSAAHAKQSFTAFLEVFDEVMPR